MWKFWNRDSSASASINREYFGSEKPIFRRLFLPPDISCSGVWWIELLFFLHSMEEGDEVDANDEDGGCVVSSPLSCNFSSRDDLITKFWFSWQDLTTREEYRLGSTSNLICSNITSPGDGCKRSEALLGWWRYWIMIPSPLSTSWTLCFGPGSMVLAPGDSFLKTRPRNEAQVNDLSWWGATVLETPGYLFWMEVPWCDVITLLHILEGLSSCLGGVLYSGRQRQFCWPKGLPL